MEEQLKPIKDFDGYYITDKGDVYSTIKKGSKKKNIRTIPYKLKPRPGKNGYMRVYMRRTSTGKRCDQYIHILTANAFLLKPRGKNTVNHKDFDKSHNWDSNLEWLTMAENLEYTRKAGRLCRDPKTGKFYSNM